MRYLYKKKLKICLLLALGMLLHISVYAQQITVTGTVVDNAGDVLPGVNISIMGTMQGTVTDIGGKFTIGVPDENATLQFSFVGYTTQEIIVGNQRVINMTMLEASTTLDEIVVIGYQSVRRRDLTGSVASVSGNDIASAPVTDVAQALQGKLPGVNIMSQDGRPDAEIYIRVRGGGSISQSNEPLILIDGIPGSISDIPADMVASVDVLKDASSTAIYGARGANGVILVTTKSPKEGRVAVNYNGFMKFNTPTGYMKALKPYDYLALKWGLLDTYFGSAYTDPFEELFGIGAHGDINRYKNVPAYNIQKEVYNSSFSHNHDLSISAGNDKTKVLFAVGYVDEEGMKINSRFKRATASFKLDQKLYKNLNFNLDVRYMDREAVGYEGTENGYGSPLSGSYRFRPIATEDILGNAELINHGTVTGEDSHVMLDMYNPIRAITDRENTFQYRGLRGTSGINWTIINGLTYRSELTFGRGNITRKNWNGPGIRGDYLRADGTILYAGDAVYRKDDNWSLRWSNTLNYNIVLNKIHRINVLAGQEVTNSGGEWMQISGNKYPANFTRENVFAMISQYGSDLVTSSGVSTPGRILSYFGRLNYSLLDKYLFTFTMRADGSSRFSPDHRWGYFPAAAVAWRVSQESFLKDVEWLDDLKIRASYGQVGNDAISADQWSQMWAAHTGDHRYGFNNTPQPSYDLASTQMANRDLKWETTITRNLGFDYSVLNNRLWGTVEIYKNTTKDLLMLTDLPGITGFTSTFANVGQTSNKGVEISLSALVFKNSDWSITAGGNINFNKGNIDELAEGVQSVYGTQFFQSRIPSGDYILEEGKPVGIVRGHISEGFYTPADFNYDAATGMYTLKDGLPDLGDNSVFTPGGVRPGGQQAYPGAPKFKDISGNEGKPDGILDEQDYVIIGNMNPKHTGGFSINVKYKGFDLGMYFNWSYGNEIYNGNKLASLYHITKGGGLFSNKLELVNDCYKVYDIQGGQLVRVTEPSALNELNKNAKLPLTYLQQGYVADIGIEKGSYLRLNTLTLGYTLPKQLVNKASINNLRVYGTIYNVYTFTNYSGLDPEIATNKNQGGARFPTPGFDWGTYPRARQFVLGLNVTF